MLTLEVNHFVHQLKETCLFYISGTKKNNEIPDTKKLYKRESKMKMKNISCNNIHQNLHTFENTRGTK